MSKKKNNSVRNWCFTVRNGLTMTIHCMTKERAIKHFKNICPNAVYYVKPVKW